MWVSLLNKWINAKVTELPSIPAGDNNIGNVDVVTLPALPSGTNVIGKVSIDQATANANEVVVKTITAGSNKLGSINIRNNANDANIDPLAEATFTARLGEVQATPTSNTLLGRLKDLLTGIVLATGNNHIGQTGYTLKKVPTSFTRPADTTTYAAGDAITNSTSAPVVFELDLSTIGAVAGQSIEIRSASIVSSVKQSPLPLLNMYLSNVTFTTTNDNSPLAIADATMEAGGKWINLETQNYTANNAVISKENANTPMILAVADTKLYGTLQAANAYPPVSGEKFTIIIWVALL